MPQGIPIQAGILCQPNLCSKDEIIYIITLLVQKKDIKSISDCFI